MLQIVSSPSIPITWYQEEIEQYATALPTMRWAQNNTATLARKGGCVTIVTLWFYLFKIASTALRMGVVLTLLPTACCIQQLGVRRPNS